MKPYVMNKIIIIVIAIVVIGGGAFFGGMKYGQARNSRTGRIGQVRIQDFAGGGPWGMMRGSADGGFIAGEILSKDEKSLTLKLRDGGSKIVFFSDSAEISKFAKGTTTDLEIGKAVSVTGTANSDGSLTAESIQLRSPQRQPGV